MKNDLADQSDLIVYADGAKANASQEELDKIRDVRKVIRQKKWCGSVTISENAGNKGLARSVITGVSEIVNKYGKVIVLEDDIVTASTFLRFMNSGLKFYSAHERIMSLTGYLEPIRISGDEILYLQKGSSWGWGTWARAWSPEMFNSTKLYDDLVENLDLDRLNFGGQDYFSMLKAQINGEINSWAIRFYTYGFLNDKLHVNPPRSLVKNIGFDGVENIVEHMMYTKRILKIICLD